MGRPKKSSPKNLNRLQFYKRNPRKNFQNRLQFSKEIPLKKFAFNFIWKSLLFFSKKSTFRLIFEKCRCSSVILEIFGATLQLDQNINPQDICPDNFSFVYKYIYEFGV